MHIAVVTFEGFNELDSIAALTILNRVRQPGWRAVIACRSARVTAMNGLAVEAQAALADARAADAVIVGSGVATRAIVENDGSMRELACDANRLLMSRRRVRRSNTSRRRSSTLARC